MMMNMSSCQSFELTTAPSAITSNVSGWLMKRKNVATAPEHPVPEQWHESALAAARKAVLGEFNRRFFWMDFNINLVYYAESPSAKRVAFIPFSRLRHVELINSPVKINQAKPGWVYGVSLRTVNRSLDLWAKTEKEQIMWMEALSKAISENPVQMNSSMIASGQSISQSPAPLTRISSLSFSGSAAQTADALSEVSSVKNENNRWSENNATSKNSPRLPPIKEVPRAAWDNISDEPPHSQATLPTVKVGSKWDDWDN